MSTLARRLATRWPILFGMREAIGMGLSALRAYKMRAGLTILGVVMGIMTVTGMSAIVAGLNKSMASQIEGFGTSVIFVRPFGPGENLSHEERRRRKGLSELELEALTTRCQACTAVAPLEFPRVDMIKYGREKVQNAQLLGTTQAQVSALMRCKPVSVLVGRLMEFLTVLGQDVKVTVKPAPRRRKRGAMSVVVQDSPHGA